MGPIRAFESVQVLGDEEEEGRHHIAGTLRGLAGRKRGRFPALQVLAAWFYGLIHERPELAQFRRTKRHHRQVAGTWQGAARGCATVPTSHCIRYSASTSTVRKRKKRAAPFKRKMRPASTCRAVCMVWCANRPNSGSKREKRPHSPSNAGAASTCGPLTDRAHRCSTPSARRNLNRLRPTARRCFRRSFPVLPRAS